MAIQRDIVKLERTVNGEKQYKTVQALNLNFRRARKAYEDAGWKPSAGKSGPVGVPAQAATKPKKQKPVESDEPQPEQNVVEE